MCASHRFAPPSKTGFAYLDFDIADLVYRPDDGPSDHRWEDVRRKVAARVAAFHKLKICGESD